MFDIGFMELLLVALIGLIVLGPERLPKAAYNLGLVIARIRQSFSKIQHELEREVHLQDLKDKMQNPYATFTDEGPNTAPTHQAQPAHHSTTEDEIATDLANPTPSKDTTTPVSAPPTADSAIASDSNRPFSKE